MRWPRSWRGCARPKRHSPGASKTRTQFAIANVESRESGSSDHPGMTEQVVRRAKWASLIDRNTTYSAPRHRRLWRFSFPLTPSLLVVDVSQRATRAQGDL